MLNRAHQDDIEQAIKRALNETYRLGLAAAIKTIEAHRGASVDPDAFSRVIDDLHRLIAHDQKVNP